MDEEVGEERAGVHALLADAGIALPADGSSPASELLREALREVRAQLGGQGGGQEEVDEAQAALGGAAEAKLVELLGRMLQGGGEASAAGTGAGSDTDSEATPSSSGRGSRGKRGSKKAAAAEGASSSGGVPSSAEFESALNAYLDEAVAGLGGSAHASEEDAVKQIEDGINVSEEGGRGGHTTGLHVYPHIACDGASAH